MNDRFKFRFYDLDKKIMIKPSDEMSDIEWENVCCTYGEDEWYWCIEAKLPTILDYFDNDDYYKKHFTIMQCTGLKDKNGKLIYEGDIVKYAEFDWTDFSFKDWETEIAQVVWGNTYDNYYPAFDLKYTDFDGTNAFAYLFNEGWTIEVIGNIYENKELLESEG